MQLIFFMCIVFKAGTTMQLAIHFFATRGDCMDAVTTVSTEVPVVLEVLTMARFHP